MGWRCRSPDAGPIAGEASDVSQERAPSPVRDDELVRAVRETLIDRLRRLLRSARNRVLCSEAVTLEEGDEVGFFPPVTGG